MASSPPVSVYQFDLRRGQRRLFLRLRGSIQFYEQISLVHGGGGVEAGRRVWSTFVHVRRSIVYLLRNHRVALSAHARLGTWRDWPEPYLCLFRLTSWSTEAHAGH